MRQYALFAVWGLRSDDVWAVGGKSEGDVLHWDGLTWTVMARHPDMSSLEGVWASAPDDLWVVGRRTDGTGEILHWDGHAWAASGLKLSSDLREIWGSSAGDVWAVGASGAILHH